MWQKCVGDPKIQLDKPIQLSGIENVGEFNSLMDSCFRLHQFDSTRIFDLHKFIRFIEGFIVFFFQIVVENRLRLIDFVQIDFENKFLE